MKKYSFSISGHKYEVDINDIEGKIAHISVNGTDYEIEIDDEKVTKKINKAKTPFLKRTSVSDAVEGQSENTKSSDGNNLVKISAPLPGSIVKVNVSVGDIVKAGDCLLLMEAMKMENKVSAEKGGLIKSVKVSVGDTVLQGDTLFEIA